MVEGEHGYRSLGVFATRQLGEDRCYSDREHVVAHQKALVLSATQQYKARFGHLVRARVDVVVEDTVGEEAEKGWVEIHE